MKSFWKSSKLKRENPLGLTPRSIDINLQDDQIKKNLTRFSLSQPGVGLVVMFCILLRDISSGRMVNQPAGVKNVDDDSSGCCYCPLLHCQKIMDYQFTFIQHMKHIKTEPL